MPTIQKLHPTLKKCKCGFIGNKTQLYKHFDYKRRWAVFLGLGIAAYHRMHGEVPINEDEGDKFLNAEWLKGTPKGYND